MILEDAGVLPLITTQNLERMLSEPSEGLVRFIAKLDGDITILGAGGKMGPSLAHLLRRTIDAAGVRKRVIAVSRFSNHETATWLRSVGVKVVSVDLLDWRRMASLPHTANVIDLLGQKFGTTGNEPQTWMMNTYLAGKVAETFKDSRIVFYSTGNVYPLVPVESGGATEEQAPAPVGEYAQSRLGGERILEYFSREWGTRLTIMRLNYAAELRYGVIHDVAKMIVDRKPIDLTMGYVNVIWQRDANEAGVRSLGLASSPPFMINVTGEETVSVRRMAERLGELLGIQPIFTGQEQGTSLLSNAGAAEKLFDFPRVKVDQVMRWVADWISSGGASLGKPTHYQEREGLF